MNAPPRGCGSSQVWAWHGGASSETSRVSTATQQRQHLWLPDRTTVISPSPAAVCGCSVAGRGDVGLTRHQPVQGGWRWRRGRMGSTTRRETTPSLLTVGERPGAWSGIFLYRVTQQCWITPFLTSTNHNSVVALFLVWSISAAGACYRQGSLSCNIPADESNRTRHCRLSSEDMITC